MTSTRPREGRGVRNAAGGEHDRLKRAVLQPVQCWDKKWAESKNGKQLQVFKWVKSDRQVEFDDEDEDEEIEQAPIPRQIEEEVGTPVPALPTLQDADDTNASTPAQTGEDDDEDDAISTTTSNTMNTTKPPPSNPPAHTSASTSPTLSKTEKRPSLSASSLTLTGGSSHPETLAQKLIREETKGLNNNSNNTTTTAMSTTTSGSMEDDDEDDTDSSRPLETPVETQANTPQDFESMSPAPMMMDSDDLKREADVELVVKGLDEGQAEMEEEMEEKLVVKEKEQHHQHSHVINQSVSGSGSATTSVAVAGGAVVAVEHEPVIVDSTAGVLQQAADIAAADAAIEAVAHKVAQEEQQQQEEDSRMEVDPPSGPIV
ncbi:hypothetical protein BGZ95_004597 [Linnemannia exigua]|uniref:Uncharacterized protein n=1 Tax=Linnemannia exigua TaxID=604196 RepID=A0AAD4D375_9FUNG|nr:hypothetical protein BGZ95_004597 [Linnemannia exigua]